jgi:hypothetical protein
MAGLAKGWELPRVEILVDLYQFHFLLSWAEQGGMAERDDFKRGYWSRVEIPTRMQIFFCYFLYTN